MKLIEILEMAFDAEMKMPEYSDQQLNQFYGQYNPGSDEKLYFIRFKDLYPED